VRREANWGFDTEVGGEHVVIPEEDREHVHSVIWVGASTQNDRKWPSSNYGPLVDLFAPGDGVTSAANANDAAFKIDSGTSFVSHNNQGTLIKINSPQLHYAHRRLPTSLESLHVCSATLTIRALPPRR
jgi:hypothetical protein